MPYSIATEKPVSKPHRLNDSKHYSNANAMFNNSHSFTVGETQQVNVSGNYYDHRATNTRNVTVQDGGQYVERMESNERRNEGLKALSKRSVIKATHNCIGGFDFATCHPNTRKRVKEDILQWITGAGQQGEASRIMWVTGPAGTGKTAIAGSVSEHCADLGILAGSFFFSCTAGGERSSKWGLIPTMAYCFAQHPALQVLRRKILSSIEKDPSIFDQRLSHQSKVLLTKPFHDAGSHLDRSSLPRVIIIDGVDEIKANESRYLEPAKARMANATDQEEVLKAMLQAVRDTRFPFRILIFSRPETVIQNFFSNQANGISARLVLDSTYNPDSDIAIYLRSKLLEIRCSYPSLPASWGDEGVVRLLVDNACGQFIYASTVIRFLQEDTASPEDRLNRVMGLDSGRLSANPFAELDNLYRLILEQSPDAPLAVKWISCMRYTLSGYPAFFVNHLLQEKAGDVDFLLGGLSSLLSVRAKDLEKPYDLYHHKSLSDFLGSAERCGQELHASFTDVHFLHRQLARTLRNKGPVGLLNDFERTSFMVIFFELLTSYHFYDLLDAAQKDEAIALCLEEADIGWWIETAIATLPRTSRGYASEARLFVELVCPTYDTPSALSRRPRTVYSYAEDGEIMYCGLAVLKDGYCPGEVISLYLDENPLFSVLQDQVVINIDGYSLSRNADLVPCGHADCESLCERWWFGRSIRISAQVGCPENHALHFVRDSKRLPNCHYLWAHT
ncbi:hypothetical protein NMY22_g3236 [Coprinellus aureogranulatus]|nr:hypothetical protein NMY22_g3236 [Coprinellus aureogranulatus]